MMRITVPRRLSCVSIGCLLSILLILPVFAQEITLHYHRPNEDYDGWTMWTWNPDSGKTKELTAADTDDFGLTFHVQTDDYDNPRRIGLLPKFTNWESKDDPEHMWTTELGNEIYIVSADKTLHAGRPSITPRVIKAMVDDTDRIRLILSKGIPENNLPAARIAVRDGQGGEYAVRSLAAVGRIKDRVNVIEAHLAGEFPADRISGGMVQFEEYRPGPLVHGKILDHPVFSSDLPLGADWSAEETVFRTFAPTALAVNVRLYRQPQGGEPEEYPMAKLGNGVWGVSVGGDIRNRYYTYQTRFTDGEYEVIDPYTQCNTAHNGRGMIVVDRTPVAPPPVFAPKDAIIYEMHIRDFTIDPSSGVPASHRGKYLGLTALGSTLDGEKNIKTGIDHIKELGVNVVQIMPFFDFDNNEASEDYNWGYMTFHFFAPDGWFATRRDDVTRVGEVKKMVDAFHRSGIKVVIDVVYNHTAEGNPSVRVSFNGLAPNYYYRLRDDGSYWNGSGTGNEFRSESPMGRKYIIDSLKYWVREYDVDGFRFDLMGLIDLETCKQLVSEVRKIKPDALIYGEPWAGGGTPIDKTEKGDQRGLGFAVFNDHFRDAIKGSTFSNDPGFIQAAWFIGKIKRGIKGSITDFAKEPTETINYIEAHDNHTLWDRLINTMKTRSNAPTDALVKMDKLGAALVLTSQGIPFIQAGQEMLRTKDGEDNSYNKPDAVNMIHWRWKKENREVFEYYRNLIRVRRRHPMFRMATAAEVKDHLFFLDDDLGYAVPANTVGYVLHRGSTGDEWANAVLLFNPNSHSVEFTVPPSDWNPASAGAGGAEPAGVGDAGTWGAGGAEPAGVGDAGTWGAGGAEPAGVSDAGTWGAGGADPAGLDASLALGLPPLGSDTIQVPGWSAGIFYNTDNTFFEKTLKPRLAFRKIRMHKFLVKAPKATRVSVAGSFNAWKGEEIFLAKQPDGRWAAEMEMEPGEYEYKFIADGVWDALNKDNRKLVIK